MSRRPLKDVRLNLCISREEREAWHEAARKAGMPLAQMVRMAVQAQWLEKPNASVRAQCPGCGFRPGSIACQRQHQ